MLIILLACGAGHGLLMTALTSDATLLECAQSLRDLVEREDLADGLRWRAEVLLTIWRWQHLRCCCTGWRLARQSPLRTARSWTLWSSVSRSCRRTLVRACRLQHYTW